MFKRFIKKFTDKEIEYVKIDSSYFLKNKKLEKLNNHPSSFGLYLGKEEGNKFHPSLALLEIVAKGSKDKVVVDEKREWLFLCGRDIFLDKKIKILGRGVDFKLIQNERDENLGIGKISKASIKNVFNRGDFLKREFQ